MQYFLMALTLVFVIAKLTGHIDWSWWLVMLPMLPAFVMWLVAMIFIGIVGATLKDAGGQSYRRRIR